MRKQLLNIHRVVALLLVSGWIHGMAWASYNEEFVTGKDWVKNMSQREKYMSLLPPTLLFSEYDVNLKVSLPQYISLIDHVMRRNPQLEDQEVSNIFASTVYLVEPENRQALRAMEMNFLRGDFSSEATRAPRLSIEDVLKESSGQATDG